MEVFDIQASVCSSGFVLQLETTEIWAKEWQSKSCALEKLVVDKMNSRRQGLVSMPEVFKTRISVWAEKRITGREITRKQGHIDGQLTGWVGMKKKEESIWLPGSEGNWEKDKNRLGPV